MFTSAELIEALQRRARRSLRPLPPPGEFPPGWRAWFAVMRERVGKVTGATSQAIVAILLQREPARPPPREAELNRWQAFGTLWRQEWQPVTREGRGERIAAYVITIIVHLVLAGLLVWLSWARFGAPPMPAGEEVVQVEFIGKGTPREVGGGTPSGPQPEPQTATKPKSPGAQPSRAGGPVALGRVAKPELPPPPAPPRPVLAEPEPLRPQPPQPVAAQPLVVTQTQAPDTSFRLTAPTPPQVVVRQPQLQVPQLQQQPRALDIQPTPRAQVQVLHPQLQVARIEVPQLDATAETLPSPQASLQQAQARAVELPQARLQVPQLSEQAGTLTMRAPGSGESPQAQAATASAGQDNADNATGTAASASDSGGNAPVASQTGGGPPAMASGTGAQAPGAGAGPEPTAKPGAWPSPVRGDDWGLSDRNRPGGQAGKPGLFDENGRPRLAPGDQHEPGGGLPPGMSSDDLAHLDRAGTWLKRPPINYKPTRFDRFWIPRETLLQEWVRRNIRELSIPLPGGKQLHCVVSLLQLGGGCLVTDPDLNDQEAIARPPPDIPFKPELQENQGILQQPTQAPAAGETSGDQASDGTPSGQGSVPEPVEPR